MLFSFMLSVFASSELSPLGPRALICSSGQAIQRLQEAEKGAERQTREIIDQKKERNDA